MKSSGVPSGDSLSTLGGSAHLRPWHMTQTTCGSYCLLVSWYLTRLCCIVEWLAHRVIILFLNKKNDWIKWNWLDFKRCLGIKHALSKCLNSYPSNDCSCAVEGIMVLWYPSAFMQSTWKVLYSESPSWLSWSLLQHHIGRQSQVSVFRVSVFRVQQGYWLLTSLGCIHLDKGVDCQSELLLSSACL